MIDPFHRLVQVRRAHGYDSPTDAARAFGFNEVTYRAHENGQRGIRQEAAERYAKAFGVSPSWILFGDTTDKPDFSAIVAAREAQPLEKRPIPPDYSGDTVPVFGSVEGGPDGRFQFNGDIVDRIAAPPGLRGAKDAYALYVSGTSMEPRYFEGEAVYVHPGKPVRQGDFVVLHLNPSSDGEPVGGVVKRLVSKSALKIVVEQYNPPMTIEFNAAEVGKIDRIVLGGE